jgi:cell division protein FtsA
VGVPNYVGSLTEVVRNPRYSTVVGLLLSGVADYQREQIVRMHGASFRQVFDRMRNWFQVNF